MYLVDQFRGKGKCTGFETSLLLAVAQAQAAGFDQTREITTRMQHAVNEYQRQLLRSRLRRANYTLADIELFMTSPMTAFDLEDLDQKVYDEKFQTPAAGVDVTVPCRRLFWAILKERTLDGECEPH
jgi:hypothetical protein